MRVEIASSIAEFDGDSWNRLLDRRYPFLDHAFLLAAETNGCVSHHTGWTPRHVGLRDNSGELKAAMPLYEKTHSWGEFVFDWNWANAYERAGHSYYPKLVSASPFTPAQSPRLLAANDSLKDQLLEAACAHARSSGHSSLHIQFPLPDEMERLRKHGLKIRKDCQFHWHNRNYTSFEDFLGTFNAVKRKKARRDRRHVREQGFRYRWLSGENLDAAIRSDVYDLISTTFLRRGSMPYFSKEFFLELSRTLPDSVLVVLAERNRMPAAAAVFFDSAQVLYGRYWGCDDDYNALHFETCYYQGIEYCIANGRQSFEPGTQGEHKISRGFTPVTTWSAHWLRRPEFFAAIGNYVDRESEHIERYMAAVSEHSPYKANPDRQT